MTPADVRLCFDPGLRLFLPARHRRETVRVAHDGTATLGHLIEALGVPLTEAGTPTADGRPLDPGAPPDTSGPILVPARPRPQPVPDPPPRFTLDVHLGALARRLRLLGVDAAYPRQLDDPALVEHANAQRRVLLTKDRGLLRRHALTAGAYVRGDRPDRQLADVLDRFAPPLAPLTRCTRCNTPVAPAAKADVEQLLEPGTRRCYQSFARCPACGQVYWQGAHYRRLQVIIDTALSGVTDDPGA